MTSFFMTNLYWHFYIMHGLYSLMLIIQWESSPAFITIILNTNIYLEDNLVSRPAKTCKTWKQELYKNRVDTDNPCTKETLCIVLRFVFHLSSRRSFYSQIWGKNLAGRLFGRKTSETYSPGPGPRAN